VVSVGNLTIGGTGKTPVVELAVRALTDLGARPAVVSRGYGRRSRGIQVVADGRGLRLGVAESGDEPFLLARRLPGVPVVVGADRHAAGELARSALGASVVVLDDGFQQRSLEKDLEIVLARASEPWGNGRLFPAGPLREPLGALARADLVIVSGGARPGDVAQVRDEVWRHAPGVPVLAGSYEPAGCWTADGLRSEPPGTLAGRRLVGFAGIAWPEGFRRTLEAVGVELAGFESLPDHVWYGSRGVAGLAARAAAAGAEGLVTTEKDWVRLGTSLALPLPLWVLGVRFVLASGEDTFRDLLGRLVR
jgi:tetraacyldisaccharide 4'-kinase